LAHHALTVHRADANLSPTRSRRALGFIFYGESAREDKLAHDAYQKDLVSKMSAEDKI
jgi:phytanoyl-CoA hydroxylase